MVDVVVPPRTAYTTPALPHDSTGAPARLRANERWQVLAREDGEHEALQHEVCLLQQRQATRQANSNSQARTAGKKMSPAQRQQRSQSRNSDWAPCGQQQEDADLLEVLQQQLGSGMADTVTPPAWHHELGTAAVPVNGINLSSEPLVIRKHQRVAVGCRLASSSTVATLQEDRAAHPWEHTALS